MPSKACRVVSLLGCVEIFVSNAVGLGRRQRFPRLAVRLACLALERAERLREALLRVGRFDREQTIEELGHLGGARARARSARPASRACRKRVDRGRAAPTPQSVLRRGRRRRRRRRDRVMHMLRRRACTRTTAAPTPPASDCSTARRPTRKCRSGPSLSRSGFHYSVRHVRRCSSRSPSRSRCRRSIVAAQSVAKR